MQRASNKKDLAWNLITVFSPWQKIRKLKNYVTQKKKKMFINSMMLKQLPDARELISLVLSRGITFLLTFFLLPFFIPTTSDWTRNEHDSASFGIAQASCLDALTISRTA